MKRRLSHWLVAGSLTLCPAIFAGGAPGYVAHEWGTFTSVQGADGQLLVWRPLESSHLPGFVYDSFRPGLNRVPAANLMVNKGMMTTLQRMETPVIYFYAAEAQAVDVTVDFPLGLITEWYPQAYQIGPFAPNGQNESINPHAITNRRVRWANVQILPPAEQSAASKLIPRDKSGSHYFAARETDAAVLRIESLTATNPAHEHEKFLFYRGAGSFSTPLQVTMPSNSELALTNTGTETLAHLFVLELRDGQGSISYLDQLRPGRATTIAKSPTSSLSQAALVAQISSQMADTLVAEGLFRAEAVAMVNTWKDSWFAEDGLRVLYVLPRAWTDGILPISFTPAPAELVRVMVGRAEVISPQVADGLREDVLQAVAGDDAARACAIGALRKLGRFAEPAIRLALRNESGKTVDLGRELLGQATQLAQTAPRPESTVPRLSQ